MNELELIIQSKDNVQFLIHNKNYQWSRVVLYFLLVIMILMPLGGVVAGFMSEEPVPGGLLAFAIIAWILFMLTLYRAIFWGLWGKEIIDMNGDQLTVVYDYRLTKSKPRIFNNITAIEFEKDEYNPKKKQWKMVFVNTEDNYVSVLGLSKHDCENLTFRSDFKIKVNPPR